MLFQKVICNDNVFSRSFHVLEVSRSCMKIAHLDTESSPSFLAFMVAIFVSMYRTNDPSTGYEWGISIFTIIFGAFALLVLSAVYFPGKYPSIPEKPIRNDEILPQ